MSLLIAASVLQAADENQPKPPIPPLTIPDVQEDRSIILCVGCDQPFDTPTHKKLLDDLLEKPYAIELRKALYWQDTYHQFESKAHFDNCDFEGSMDYISALLQETDEHVEAAKLAKANGEASAFEKAVSRAFFSLGQAIHGVQDFYAHSNYVELQVSNVTKVTDIPVISTWRPEGPAEVEALRADGLISGYVFWGFPQTCPSGTPSHGDLAKDAADTDSGAVRVSHLQNISRYRIAKFLARESSLQFMEDAFLRWPLLKDANGPNIILDVLVDRRGLP